MYAPTDGRPFTNKFRHVIVYIFRRLKFEENEEDGEGDVFLPGQLCHRRLGQRLLSTPDHNFDSSSNSAAHATPPSASAFVFWPARFW